LSFFFLIMGSYAVFAGTIEEEFKIEGLISPASPKALKSALEKELEVKVIDLNLKSTKTDGRFSKSNLIQRQSLKKKLKKSLARLRIQQGISTRCTMVRFWQMLRYLVKKRRLSQFWVILPKCFQP